MPDIVYDAVCDAGYDTVYDAVYDAIYMMPFMTPFMMPSAGSCLTEYFPGCSDFLSRAGSSFSEIQMYIYDVSICLPKISDTFTFGPEKIFSFPVRISGGQFQNGVISIKDNIDTEKQNPGQQTSSSGPGDTVGKIPGRPVVEVIDVCKSYQMGTESVSVLNHINFTVQEGEFVSIVGPSGSGKSTIMNLLGCLDRPTSGTILINGQDVSLMNDRQLANLRGLEIGFIFQKYNLVSRLNVLDNVLLPTFANKNPDTDTKQRALDLLEMVGLSDHIYHRPSELSGGQSQRVAIARALINDPTIVLADEPTGALDSKSGDDVMNIFSEMNQRGATIIMITHNRELAERTDRIISVKDGYIIRSFCLPACTVLFSVRLFSVRLFSVHLFSVRLFSIHLFSVHLFSLCIRSDLLSLFIFQFIHLSV